MATINGTANNDTLNGTSSADTITGGLGNDSMDGGAGADTYVYNLGDGHDTVTSSGGLLSSQADIVKFGPGISMADVNATLEGTTLVLTLTNNRGSVRVLNYSSGLEAGRLRVQFGDGLIWDTTTINRILNNNIDNNGDYLEGTAGNDYLLGGAGDDILSGGAGNDTLYGDTGMDFLTGEGGQNVYYFGRGDGQDFIGIYTLAEGTANQSDVVRLGSDITMADITVVNDANNASLHIRGTNDAVHLLNVAEDPTLYNASIVFADGTSWDKAALVRKLNATNDVFNGTAGNDFWDGGMGNDTLNGGAGADSLYGGTGNDLLNGGAGADTFYFGRGDGRDTIVANSADSAGDRLLLASAIGISDVEVRQEGNDILLNIIGSLDSVRLQGYLTQTAANRPVVQFADGTSWNSAVIERKINATGLTLTGTAAADAIEGGLGNDTLSGGAGNDTLYGDAGNDFMDGGDGADTYHFGRGDGFDTVVAGAASAGQSDRVLLGHGIMLTDFAATRSGNDLILNLLDSNDGLRVQNYFSIAAADRVKFVFRDGVIWDAATIDRKVNNTSDSLTGTAGNDVLDGGLGDDTISALGGVNLVYGDAGNDLLIGGEGTNTYFFGYGDGHDTLVASTSFLYDQQDLIQWGSGITAADIDAVIDPVGSSVDLLLRLRATGDSLRLKNFVSDADSYSISMRFGDGSVVSLQQMKGMYQGVDDITNGTSGSDVLHSGLGQDLLFGLEGDDTLYGDAGADTMDGGEGADTYLYGRGDGRDVIIAGAAHSTGDQLLLSRDLDATSLDFARSGQDLVISVRGSLDNVTLRGYFNLATANRMSVRFADGYAMDGAAVERKLGLVANTLTATAGDDRLEGNHLAETLTGLGGNDTLYGDGGNDSLDGGAGADTYLFGRGDGQDTVVGGAGDRLSLGRDISMADVDVSLSGQDLLVTIKGGKDQDSVLVKGYTSVAAADRLRIDFMAGGSWDAAAIDRKLASANDTLNGTALSEVLDGGLGNDTLNGGAGDDTLYGDAGDDVLNGGAGADTYHFGRGDGADRIVAGTAAERRGDVVQFGAGINLADVSFAMSGAALVATIKGSSDRITIDNYTAQAFADRIAFRFADGAVLGGEAMDKMLLGELDGLWGGSGHDAFHGGVGDDVLAGLEGDDTLYGGVGNDWMGGGYGNDTYYFGRGDGVDTITAGAYDPAGSQDRLVLASDIAPNQVTLTRSGSDLLVGIVGTNDRAVLEGWFDRVVADRTLIQFGNGWTWDAAALTRQFTAGNDTLQGSAGEDMLFGGLGNDSLNGLAGNDYLMGGDGLDTLNGGAGIDTLVGGAGDDTYYVDHASDLVIETADGGTYDKVYALTSYVLPDHIEYAELQGTGNFNLTSGKTATQLYGNAGNNVLTGGSGADELSGEGGQDTLIGGNGNDVYLITDNLDTVIEQASSGSDTYFVWVDNITMANNVERAYLADPSAKTITGNQSANRIYGNQVANVLYGMGGIDYLSGGGGNDTLVGGKGYDLLVGGAGNDTYLFNPGDDMDVIENLDTTGFDTVRMTGVTESQIWLTREGLDLGIVVIGTGDAVYVRDWFKGANFHIDEVRLDNGKALSAAKVDGLLQAMSAFAEPASTTLPANYQAALNPIIAASWT